MTFSLRGEHLEQAIRPAERPAERRQPAGNGGQPPMRRSGSDAAHEADDQA